MSDHKLPCVVLKVIDGATGHMASYGPQVATIQKYESLEDAATFNVGSHPDVAKNGGKPYRVIVIPAEHWHEFLVYSNRIRGVDTFEAVPNDKPTIKPNDPS